MKNSLVILAFFLAGTLTGFYISLPPLLTQTDVSLYVLYALLFLVGTGIGSNTATRYILKRAGPRIILVPLGVIGGTLLGVTLVSYLLPATSLRAALAVGAGFGYYSLSSILIGQISGETLGVVALLANIMREMLTLLLTPLLVRYAGRLAPIASGGATTMDTTLPIITRFSGTDYGIIAVFSGLVLTILVPFLVTLILNVA